MLKIFMKYARKMHISKPSLFLLSGIKLFKQLSVTDLFHGQKGFDAPSHFSPFDPIHSFRSISNLLDIKQNSSKFLLCSASSKP